MNRFTLSSIFTLSLAFSLQAQPLDVFDVHFAVITKNPKAQRRATLEQLHKEVEILNEYFVSEQGEAIVRFRFKAAHFYDEVRDSPCRFVDLGDSTEKYDSDGWAKMFNKCHDPKVRDPYAINFYVYDSYSPGKGFADKKGHGKRNSNRPYILIDWKRLNHTSQSPEEHEMGHAFGLQHVCVPGATRQTSTNIMASSECDNGSGGLRDIGFSAKQVKTILEYSKKIERKLERGE